MGKFRIKISSTYFSDEWINIKYSTNGIFWKRVYGYKYEILDKWCYMSPLTVHYTNAEEYINRFKSIKDIEVYEQKEKKRVYEHNKEISESNRLKKKSLRDTYKKYGK